MRRLAENHKEAILVAWKGRLFSLWASGGIAESADGIEVQGAGYQYAKGAAILYRELRPCCSARAMAVRAVEVAIRCSGVCEGPIVVHEMACRKDS